MPSELPESPGLPPIASEERATFDEAVVCDPLEIVPADTAISDSSEALHPDTPILQLRPFETRMGRTESAGLLKPNADTTSFDIPKAFVWPTIPGGRRLGTLPKLQSEPNGVFQKTWASRGNETYVTHPDDASAVVEPDAGETVYLIGEPAIVAYAEHVAKLELYHWKRNQDSELANRVSDLYQAIIQSPAFSLWMLCLLNGIEVMKTEPVQELVAQWEEAVSTQALTYLEVLRNEHLARLEGEASAQTSQLPTQPDTLMWLSGQLFLEPSSFKAAAKERFRRLRPASAREAALARLAEAQAWAAWEALEDPESS